MITIYNGKRPIQVLLFLLMGLLLTACKPVEKEDRYKVLVTTTPVAHIVESLLGDEVEIDVLMGPGVDPHSYTPTAGDVSRILESQMLISSGLNLEGRMGQVFMGLEEKGVATYALGDVLDKSLLLEESPGVYDPHIWWDPVLWSQTLEPLGEFLARELPDHKDQIQENLLSYEDDLKSLDREAREMIEKIPREKRVLVTGHDAFSYFARSYGFEVMSIQGLNSNDEAGAGRIDTLAKVISQREIGAIFAERGNSGKNIEVLLEASQGYGFTPKLGGRLYTDSLGQEGPEAAYRGAFMVNLNNIFQGLGEVK